jgi:hypothetical protein
VNEPGNHPQDEQHDENPEQYYSQAGKRRDKTAVAQYAKNKCRYQRQPDNTVHFNLLLYDIDIELQKNEIVVQKY